MTAVETWNEFWKLVMGSSTLGEVLRAMIFYVAVLLFAYLVVLVNATAGAILTLLLLLLSVGDLIKTSEAGWRYLWKRAPSTIATTIVARLLGQELDYAFGIVFVTFLFLAAFDHFFPDARTGRRRRKRQKS